MGKVITDNSKVNQNLLAENERLKKQVETLNLEIEKLKQALGLSDVSEWVAYSKREPKIEKEYLVFTVWKSHHIAEWYDKTFIIDGGALSINSDITHWKEIEPPIL